MKILVLILSIFALSACVKVSDIEEKNPQPVAHEVANKSESPQVKLQLIELPEPNHYQVEVKIAGSVQSIERLEKVQKGAATGLPLSREQFLDETVEPGKTYIYKAVVDSNHPELNVESEITIPVDYELNQELVLQKDERWIDFHRIFLGPNAVITMGPYKLTLVTDQLFTNKSLIRGFPAPVAMVDEGTGAAGGDLHISTRTGQGDIRIELRGDFGQAGGYVGERGGDSGSGDLLIRETHDLHPQVDIKPGQQGYGKVNALALCAFNNDFQACKALEQPARNGNKGQFCQTDFRGRICW